MSTVDGDISAKTAAPSARVQPMSAGAVGTVRDILFVAILALSWITVKPFVDLADPSLNTLSDNSDLINQLAYLVLAGTIVLYFLIHEPSRWRPLLRPAYFAMLAWFAITTATSMIPSLSVRRIVFCMLVIVLAAALPLLPTTYRRFCDMLAGVALAVLALCFTGVVLAPELSIHQMTDIVEPSLAGNWRGIFGHKNIAGPMMVIFIFIGIFVAKARNAVLGCIIIAAAAVFLSFTQAKAATQLLPVVLGLSWLTLRLRSPLLRAAVVFGFLILLNLLTVGSLFFDGIAAFNKIAMSDPTFTGRTDIWEFAIENIRERPLLGYGFGAFWETPFTYFQPTVEGSQVTFAGHAHSGFLDLALTIGLPGLALAMIWTLVLPFRDFQRCNVNGANPELAALFLRIWMFGIYTCCFESLLFDRGDPTWFTMLVAMFGLRYLSTLGVNNRPFESAAAG
jgi:O-antigen ligase